MSSTDEPTDSALSAANSTLVNAANAIDNAVEDIEAFLRQIQPLDHSFITPGVEALEHDLPTLRAVARRAYAITADITEQEEG